MGIFDIIILVLYFVIVIAVGFIVARKDDDTREFFIANRKLPWWAVLLSIVATEISAATFVAVPATGYRENMNYLQFGFGSFCARFAIAFMFIGAFYKFDCVTVYDYLAKRFGNHTRYTAAIFYYINCILGAGVRVLIASVAMSVIMDWPLHWSIILFTVATVIYTVYGGIKAVVWNDVFQAILFIAGGIGALVFIIYHIPGGIDKMMQLAEATGKTSIFHWTPTVAGEQSFWQAWWKDPNLFWIAFLNAFVTTFAAFGTNQDMTQRMLTCKTPWESKKSLMWSAVVAIPVVIMFLFIGVALYAYYQHFPDPNLPKTAAGLVDTEKIFPYFIRNVMPDGLKGLLLVGILAAAMSSLDAALGAISSSVVVDIYKPLIHPNGSDKHYLLVSRLNIVFFGFILALIAWIFRDSQGFLWLCFKVVSIPYGALLGIFLLGITTTKGRDSTNLFAMITSAITTTVLLILIEQNRISLGWSWAIIIGTSWTYVVGYFGGWIFEKKT